MKEEYVINGKALVINSAEIEKVDESDWGTNLFQVRSFFQFVVFCGIVKGPNWFTR